MARICSLTGAVFVFLSDAFRSRVGYVACRYVSGEGFIRPKGIFVGRVRVRRAGVVSNVRPGPRFAYRLDDFGGEDGDDLQVFEGDDDVEFYVGFCSVDADLDYVFGRLHVDECGCEDAGPNDVGHVGCLYRGVGIGLYVPAKVKDGLEEEIEGWDCLIELCLRRGVGGLKEEVPFGVGFYSW